ncbi:MAG: hypothetical protein KatS3mg102_1325 [Planctomycetota bacterium]|nr:MAG: hypothetical protein KatS3mg102_1325 [Planctomycetota bacterium]
MRVLLVGAGAVGQVYGRHLALGGAEVSFLLKPKHLEAARRGFAMYPYNDRRHRTEPVRFACFGVLGSMSEVRAGRWDQVWLCVSSDALRAGGWFAELLEAIGGAAVVTLQVGLGDAEWVAERAGAERVLFGLITFLAWPGPLGGEGLPEPGICYWVPPLVPTLLQGPAPPVAAALGALRRGGLPARAARGVVQQAALSAAMVSTGVAALELAGWRFGALVRGPWLGLGRRAAREAVAIAAGYYGRRPPRLVPQLFQPWLVRALMPLVRWVVPFDMERYLQVHFSKVGRQTRQHLERLIAEGRRQGLPAGALQELHRRLGPPAR